MDTIRATRDLAAWTVAPGAHGEISDRARTLVEISLIDTIACAFAGTMEPGVWAMKRVLETGGPEPISLWGMGGASHPRDAALLNGMLAHMLDFDDGDPLARTHPSCMLVSALMALAEPRRLSGMAVIDAYLTGYKVMQLVGGIAARGFARRGVQVTSTVGIVGAVAAASRILGLNADQAAIAYGIAAGAASGVRANFGTDMKGFHAGRAASMGVEAALMAREGVTASKDLLEAKDGGFMSVYAGPEYADQVRGEVDRLISGEYSIEAEPPIIKRYACCHSAHTCIEGILALRPWLIGQLDSIQEIRTEVPEDGGIFLIHERPTTGMEGKFSMQGALAAALIEGRAGADVFVDATFQREDVRALMPRIRMEVTDRMTAISREKKLPGKLTVITATETMVEERHDPRGARSLPLDKAEISEKFRECADRVLSSEKSEEVLAVLANFRDVADVSRVSRLLRGGDAASNLSVGHADQPRASATVRSEPSRHVEA